MLYCESSHNHSYGYGYGYGHLQHFHPQCGCSFTPLDFMVQRVRLEPAMRQYPLRARACRQMKERERTKYKTIVFKKRTRRPDLHAADDVY